MNLGRKHYMEDVETLDYIKNSVPKQEDSKWIREATRAKMVKELKANQKKNA